MMEHGNRILAAGVALSLLILNSPVAALAAEPSSNFEITWQRKADSVEVVKEQGVTVFVVSSSNGIGWAKLRTEKAWPMKAKVRLQYAGGREWEHLEEFSITNARGRIVTSLKRGVEYQPISDAGRREKEELDRDELARRIATPLDAQDGKIEILLPIIWLANENEFTIRWIDQFRN